MSHLPCDFVVTNQDALKAVDGNGLLAPHALEVDLVGEQELDGHLYDRAVFSLMMDLWKAEPAGEPFSSLVSKCPPVLLDKDQNGKNVRVRYSLDHSPGTRTQLERCSFFVCVASLNVPSHTCRSLCKTFHVKQSSPKDSADLPNIKPSSRVRHNGFG